VLALIMSYNVIADSKQQLGYSGIRFAVPWLDLAPVFAAVLLAALAATSVSAYRAARIYPAEALRYQ
jgi:ABC-type lipoprotein release transport system permease subunit